MSFELQSVLLPQAKSQLKHGSRLICSIHFDSSKGQGRVIDLEIEWETRQTNSDKSIQIQQLIILFDTGGSKVLHIFTPQSWLKLGCSLLSLGNQVESNVWEM